MDLSKSCLATTSTQINHKVKKKKVVFVPQMLNLK